MVFSIVSKKHGIYKNNMNPRIAGNAVFFVLYILFFSKILPPLKLPIFLFSR